MNSHLPWAAGLAFLLTATAAAAEADSLGAAVAGEWSTAALPPADFLVSDYVLEPLGAIPPGLRVTLEAGSLEWVGLPSGLKLPRAVARVELTGVEAATVALAGSVLAVPIGPNADGQLFLPLPLLSGPEHGFVVSLLRHGQKLRSRFQVRFRPRPQHRGAVLIDASCSGVGVAVRRGKIPPDSWMTLACRSQPVTRPSGHSPAATVSFYWDNAGSEIQLDGIPLEVKSDSLYSLRLLPQPKTVRLTSRGHSVVIGHSLPNEWHAAFVSAGFGPYLYRYRDDDNDISSGANLLTLYGGYSLSSTSRIVYFNAIPLHPHSFSDQGIYFWSEQFRMLDGRMKVNLLLGFHTLLFSEDNRLRIAPSLPQGVELSLTDFAKRNHNLLSGVFYYPEISRRSYLNFWVRFGNPRLFVELNCIAWKEPVGKGSVESESVGLSVGTPLLRLF